MLWSSVRGRGQKSGPIRSWVGGQRGGLGPLPESCRQPVARGLKALAAGTLEIPTRLLALGPPQLTPWCPAGTRNSPSQVPASRAGLGARSECHVGVKVTAGKINRCSGWSDPEASSSACLGASSSPQGVLTHLCLLLSSSRAQGLLPAQLQGPEGAKVGATWNFPQPAPLTVPGVPPAGSCPMPAFPRRAELAGEGA